MERLIAKLRGETVPGETKSRGSETARQIEQTELDPFRDPVLHKEIIEDKNSSFCHLGSVE